jgi:hypothetical protein
MKQTKQIKGIILGIVIGVGVTSATSVFANQIIDAVFKDDFKYEVNGKSVTVPPSVVVDNQTYLKVREFSELLGYKVTYDEATRKIMMNNGQAPTPVVEATKELPSVAPTKKQSQREIDLSVPVKKLPITITKGNYTITVNSIKKVEAKGAFDPKHLINVTLVNNGNYPTSVNVYNSAFANLDLKDKEYYSLGYPLPFFNWEDRFKEKQKTVDLPYRSIREGTQNIRLFLNAYGLPSTEVGNMFVFNIDTSTESL